MKWFGVDTNSGMFRKISDWFGWNFHPNHSGICIRTKQFHSDLIRKNFSIQINPNETIFFEIIRIDSDRPESFGLKVRIDSE